MLLKNSDSNILTKYNAIYIHVPKTGGGTVNNTIANFLKKKNIHSYKQCHNTHSSKTININYKYLQENQPYNIYILSIRNPIKRFISAFYHHYYDSGECKGKKEVFNKSNISCINTFLDKLFINGNVNKEIEDRFIIGHLNLGFYEYLNNFLNQRSYSNIIILLTERLNADIIKKLKIDKDNIVTGHEHSYIQKNKNIAIHEKHILNLKKYLKNDYKIIDKLIDLELLTIEEYRLLIK